LGLGGFRHRVELTNDLKDADELRPPPGGGERVVGH
jgi:hypothetical protein